MVEMNYEVIAKTFSREKKTKRLLANVIMYFVKLL